MADILELKFQDPTLRDKLIHTYPQYLVEGTLWHDNVWGICLAKYCKKCEDVQGENRLGVLLMELRQKIIDNKFREEF